MRSLSLVTIGRGRRYFAFQMLVAVGDVCLLLLGFLLPFPPAFSQTFLSLLLRLRCRCRFHHLLRFQFWLLQEIEELVVDHQRLPW